MDDQVMNAENQAAAGFQSQNEIFSDSLDESDFTDGTTNNNLSNEAASTKFNKVFFERPSETLDKLNLARTLFDLKEYRKCAYNLESIHTQN